MEIKVINLMTYFFFQIMLSCDNKTEKDKMFHGGNLL